MMKEHNENISQIRDQMKNDYNMHLNIMNNLNEECEKEKQKEQRRIAKRKYKISGKNENFGRKTGKY